MNHHMFELAKKAAQTSDYNKFKIGAVVTEKGKLVALGRNSTKSHPVQREYNQYRNRGGKGCAHHIHAEIAALMKLKDADIQWNKVQIYTYRQTADGRPAMARPCNSCMELIKKLGIKKICYSTEYGYAEETIFEHTVGKKD